MFPSHLVFRPNSMPASANLDLYASHLGEKYNRRFYLTAALHHESPARQCCRIHKGNTTLGINTITPSPTDSKIAAKFSR